MKFNSMIGDNDIKKDYSGYIILAIVLAFIFSLFLNIAGKLVIMASKVLIKYWWIGIVLILLILFFRRKKKK